MRAVERSTTPALSLLVMLLLAPSSSLTAQVEEPTELDESWPKTIEADGAAFVVYQPQIDGWDGLLYQAHSAVAVTEGSSEEQLYGVISFTARTQVDKSERIVTFDRLEVTEARFPSAPERSTPLRRQLQARVADVVKFIGLDRVEAGLRLVEAEMRGRQVPVRNEPPVILFRESATLLVVVDGEPVFRAVEGSKFERLLNTRPLVLRARSGVHYLHLMDGWMSAPALAGPWTVVKKAPRKLEKAKEKALEAHPADLLAGGSEDAAAEDGSKADKPSLEEGPVPAIVVATEPTEVVVFDGPPSWVPIPGSELLYADNTTGSVFRHLPSQQLYLLISGRWFRAGSSAGPWTHVRQAELPQAFSQIPDDSPKENVKASVAGTPQAEEALIANAIPQTAEVDRGEAKFQAVYDGEPQLEAIEGTSLHYAVNSPDPVLQIDRETYYALHDGVWFLAPRAEGPWTAAVHVPAVVYSIPPSSPLHHVTYVKIYQSSPESVVVGYTPGYYGTAAVDGVVVYGTGYRYDPWVGSVWYGAPVTYGGGCGITYTPWGGWAFTFGIGWSWGHWGSSWWGPYPSPWWGPYWGWGYYSHYPSYYPYYGGVAYGARGGYVAWGPGGWAGTTGNVYHRWGSTQAVTRTSGGFDAWSGTGWRNQVGSAYNSRTGTLAAGQRAAVGNIYTGEYAYGRRGVATNTRTGTTVAGRELTVGDVDSGRQATVRQGAVVDPRSGEAVRVGGVSGDSGRAVRVGDDVYGARDGEVYRRGDAGEWERMGRNGEWDKLESRSRSQQMERERSARTRGSQRSRSFQRSRGAAQSWSGGRGAMRGRRR